MRAPGAIALYARISSDSEGSGLGVKRQLEDCQRLAETLGWSVADRYVDNDLSAYSGKRRPEYQRMLADLRAGDRDGVIVYHMDRLTRRPIELEEFVAVLDTARVKHVRFVVGDVNLGDGDGLLMARIAAAVAANESATKSRRIKRKWEQNAAAGLPHGGYFRPFGYDDDRVTIREDEASVLRALVGRFVAGESLRSLCTWMDEQGIRTMAGKSWRTTTLRDMLANPRLAGLKVHRGVVVGPAVWKPIISEDEHQRVLARIAERKATGRRTPQRYLLTGLLRCGKCGGSLFSSRRDDRTRRYVCLSGPDHGGCGRLTVVADPLERLVADLVVMRLDTPELADALSGRLARDEQTAAFAEALSEDKALLEELAGMVGRREMRPAEWKAAREPIEARIREAERRLSHASRAEALTGLVGNGDGLRTQWAGLNLSRQHAIVAAVLDHAVIGAGTSGARSLDPGRVQPIWRL